MAAGSGNLGVHGHHGDHKGNLFVRPGGVLDVLGVLDLLVASGTRSPSWTDARYGSKTSTPAQWQPTPSITLPPALQSGRRRKLTRDLLFDHLVGGHKQGLRHCQAERLSGLEIDDQFDLGGLLDRQVGSLAVFTMTIIVKIGRIR